MDIKVFSCALSGERKFTRKGGGRQKEMVEGRGAEGIYGQRERLRFPLHVLQGQKKILPNIWDEAILSEQQKEYEKRRTEKAPGLFRRASEIVHKKQRKKENPKRKSSRSANKEGEREEETIK